VGGTSRRKSWRSLCRENVRGAPSGEASQESYGGRPLPAIEEGSGRDCGEGSVSRGIARTREKGGRLGVLAEIPWPEKGTRMDECTR